MMMRWACAALCLLTTGSSHAFEGDHQSLLFARRRGGGSPGRRLQDAAGGQSTPRACSAPGSAARAGRPWSALAPGCPRARSASPMAVLAHANVCARPLARAEPHAPNARLIQLIQPAYGSVQGTTAVTMRGDFSDAEPSAQAQCRFGEVTVVAVIVGSDAIRCIAPASPTVGQVVVAATVGQQRYRTHNSSFVYHDPYALPEVSVVEPNKGGLDAGVAVTVRGVNFAPSGHMLVCEFGAIRALAPGTFVDANTIVCHAPSSTRAQSVAVRVATDGADFSQSNALFTLFDPRLPANVHSLSPQAAPLHAPSTRVTVLGSNMRPGEGLLCRFGEAGASAGK
ncbi:hypothetical protein T492DRAFT_1120096 [Pavlovales sp. CCMP2436]|nr:hypothetical protein T492DRAFT_1120096 [Pavlovales sp. CCMP2436]